VTSFFTHQDRARRNTRVLLCLMVLAVLAIGAAIFALWSFFETFYRPVAVMYGAGPGAQLDRLLTAVGGTALVVGVASTGRVLSLRGGGAQIAEMLGGRLVSGQPQGVLDKRLLNVVEEMAIAAGVPVPQVFVLDAEPGINAFAAGRELEDAAVAVTRGCLEKLTREELQGVIAHEMSHVLNGDMRLNIRLMGVVFGILCIGQLGRLMLRAGMGGNARASYGRDRDRSGGVPLAMVGFVLMTVGWIGEVFGRLIKAAVSRQREFLADASAVQFTRNPQGIAGALAKIGGHGRGAQVSSAAAEEASHFFFGDIHTGALDGSFFNTHPPLQERILRIDPNFDGQFASVPEGIAQPEEGPVAMLAAGPGEAGPLASHTPRTPGAVDELAAAGVVGHVGELTPEALDESRRLLSELPHVLRDAKDSPFSACAIVYALLLSDEAPLRERQLAVVTERSGDALQVETRRLAPVVDCMLKRDRLLLVELLAPALQRLTGEQRAGFSHTVQALIDADQQVSLFEYVLGYVLRERLGERARVGRHRSLSGVQQELSLLLSLLAYAGAAEPSHAERAFLSAAARVKGVRLVLAPASGRLLSGLAPALDSLRTLPSSLCAQVIDAAAHAALADRRVTHDEWTLLRATCAALRCPLPPLSVS
jgi:Zn-dependent protease with chaperone function